MINREDLLSGTRPEVGNRILVTEKENFQGYQVMDYRGVVWGISMRSKDLVQDTFMGCKQVTGGELTSYTELSDEVRQRAWDRMVSSAKRIGANAVINFRFEITPPTYASANAEVVAYGNAVVIKPIKNYVPLGGLGNLLAEYVDICAGNTELNSIQPDINPTSPVAQIVTVGEFTYAICPDCKMKYKLVKDENGKYKIQGLPDVDPKEAGIQIFCPRCGTKFTIPEE